MLVRSIETMTDIAATGPNWCASHSRVIRSLRDLSGHRGALMLLRPARWRCRQAHALIRPGTIWTVHVPAHAIVGASRVGLLELNNIVRHVAILIAIAGIVMLVRQCQPQP